MKDRYGLGSEGIGFASPTVLAKSDSYGLGWDGLTTIEGCDL